MMMHAKYPGRCRKCGKPIKVGDEIDWDKSRGASHQTCPTAPAERAEDGPELIRISGGSGYGCSGWKVGQVVYNKWQEQNNGPEYLTVVSCGDHYHREDGMSFGAGEDRGYTFWARCRPATEAESAPLRAERQALAARAAARNRLREIADTIIEKGELPADADPQGEKLMDTRTIYGGGEWFVIGDEHIWYVRNNGADGDDWTRNNVSTSGAGAIGWRVPVTEELATELRQLAATITAS